MTKVRQLTGVHHQQGLSLIEMVVVIGILSIVSLVIVQLYTSSLHQEITQSSFMHDIDNSDVMSESVVANMRLAGLDMASVSSGRTAAVLITDHQLLNQAKIFDDNDIQFFTATTKRKTALNTDDFKYADQLAIMYRAPQDMWDCEGQMVLGPRQVRLNNGEIQRVLGQVVIERYFSRYGEKNNELRCDAAKFITEPIAYDYTRDKKGTGASVFINAVIDKEVKVTSKNQKVNKPNTLEGFGQQGDVLIQNAVGFWVRLGVQTEQGRQFVSIDRYKQHFSQLPITSLKIAVLTQDTLGESMVQSDFEIFGHKIKLSGEQGKQYKLQQADILLRNVDF